ncbi:hypothetical protein YC2023_052277 [Brassica napus]
MYYDDLKKKLVGENVIKRLALLKVSAAVSFDEGVMSCLEHLKAAPWSEDKVDIVLACLDELHLPEDSLLRQETDHEVSKDTLYVLCHICLVSLVFCLSEATTQIKGSGKNRGALIVREADNMLWMVDKLIRKKYNKEISKDHKVLSKLRHECERAKRALNNQHQNYRKYEY